jgi:hypothetical protein
MKRDTPINLPQWNVYIVDNHGARIGPFGIATRTATEAVAKGRELFQRSAAKSQYAVKVEAERTARRVAGERRNRAMPLGIAWSRVHTIGRGSE